MCAKVQRQSLLCAAFKGLFGLSDDRPEPWIRKLSIPALMVPKESNPEQWQCLRIAVQVGSTKCRESSPHPAASWRPLGAYASDHTQFVSPLPKDTARACLDLPFDPAKSASPRRTLPTTADHRNARIQFAVYIRSSV